MLVYERDAFRILWNGSETFNVYVGTDNVDCFTCYPKSFREAVREARLWVAENVWS